MSDPSEQVKRDSRIDPRPGDVLQKPINLHAYRTREVDEVTDKTVIYVGPDVCAPEISIAAWRKWAANAEIVRQAED